MLNETTRKSALVLLLCAWALPVIGLTLSSIGGNPEPVTALQLCLACGRTGLADMVANWLLFVPLGVLASWLFGFEWAVRIAVLFSLGIEGSQIFLEGRYPALQDLLANSLGGATGAWLAVRTSERVATRTIELSVVVAWLAPTLLMLPARPAGTLYGAHAYRWPGLEAYSGRVLSASAGGHSITPGELPNSEQVRGALADRQAIELRIEAGASPDGLAPVLSVFDDDEREVLLIGAIGDDLIVRGWTWGSAVRLDQPDVRLRGALAGSQPGDTLLIEVRRDLDAYCIRAGTRTGCRLAPSLGDGWSFLRNLEGAPAGFRTGVSAAWAFLLGLTLGLASPSRRRALTSGLALAVLGLGVASLHPDVRPQSVHALILVAGTIVGALAHPLARLAIGALSPLPAPSPRPGPAGSAEPGPSAGSAA